MKVIIAISLLALSATAQAQIVKCINKDGKVEFATSCPQGTKQQDTGVSSKPAPAVAAPKDEKGNDKGAKSDAPKSLADRDAEFRKRQTEQKEAAEKSDKVAADSALRKQACDDARSYLRRMQERQRTTRTDPKTGERVFYEDEDYVREIPNAERSVADNCK